MQTNFSFLNGVDLRRLSQSISAIAAAPILGKFEFRLKNEWVNGGYNESVIHDFYGFGQEDKSREEPFVIASDEPDVLFGTDKAPNPIEYVLHALAGCLTTSLVYHAAARGYEIKKVRSWFEGDLDLRGMLGINGAKRNGLEQIRIGFDIEGDFSEEEKDEILQFGAAHSPVFDIIRNPVPVKISLSEKVSSVEIDC